jgi:hypothetical protein
MGGERKTKQKNPLEAFRKKQTEFEKRQRQSM